MATDTTGATTGTTPAADAPRVPRFRTGDRVLVAARRPPGHVRTPWYIRGHSGVVERMCGAFANPEDLAYGGTGLRAQPLYRVRFELAQVWPGYRGAPGDTIEIEIYEHWLEPAPGGSDA